MIEGTVTEDGVPTVMIELAGREWPAIIDTGFNGDLELPEQLKDSVTSRWIGPVESALAAGQVVVEDLYAVRIPFDGEDRQGHATFVDVDVILIGTRLLRRHRLEVDFPDRFVRLERRQ